MKVKSIAECSPWSILQYVWHALSDNWSSFFSSCFRKVYCIISSQCTYAYKCLCQCVGKVHYQMSTVVSLICLGPSFQKMTLHFLLHRSLRPTNLEKNLKRCIYVLWSTLCYGHTVSLGFPLPNLSPINKSASFVSAIFLTLCRRETPKQVLCKQWRPRWCHTRGCIKEFQVKYHVQTEHKLNELSLDLASFSSGFKQLCTLNSFI